MLLLGAKIYEVFTTGNYKLIPIYSCIVSVFNYIICYHGLFLKVINIEIQNGALHLLWIGNIPYGLDLRLDN